MYICIIIHVYYISSCADTEMLAIYIDDVFTLKIHVATLVYVCMIVGDCDCVCVCVCQCVCVCVCVSVCV